MKKKTAIFLTALLLLCMVIPAFAEQAVTFPQGNITSEPIELFSEHFHVSIDAGVYVPGDLMGYTAPWRRSAAFALKTEPMRR